jgi:regulator of protease activity HflC (stomatin/prohibitin superfamily)
VLAGVGRWAAAEQDAEARERLARAEAEATRMVAEAASRQGEPALRYFIADRYTRAFQAIAASPNARVVIVPMESAGFVGGIAQALEILRPHAETPRPPVAPPAPESQIIPVAEPASPWKS